MKILYIGNSITLHSPAPDIGWHGCYGMAASCEENDYLHVLNRKLEDTGKTVVWKCRNAADYERSPETYNLEEQLSEERDFSPDIIVMRLIENVPPGKTAAFRDRYVRMIRFLNPCGRAAVFCTGAFWQRDDADAWIEEAAAEVGGTYVSLKTAQGEAFQAIGLFEHGGVAGHPSDAGMAKIAELLYNAINEAGLLNGAVLYPVPEGEPKSDLYAVTVDGQPADLYTCRVSAMPLNRPWPGNQRPIEQSETAAILTFDLSAPVDVAVTVPHPFEDVTVRPQSDGIHPALNGTNICFTIDHPGQYTVEVDGRHHILHLFVNPVREFASDTENTVYFGPGVHDAGRIQLQSNQTLFVDAGAVVYGAVKAADAVNVRIIGHGIIDYSRFERTDKLEWETDGLMNLVRCQNVTVDGPILRDASWWTITAFNCQNLHYNNVKNIGMWRYNADGFDFVNCQNVRVTNCFLRNFDDCIVLKGLRLEGKYDRQNLENYLIDNCVIWCDWGGALEFGAETVADEYCNILFRDCDIIKNDQGGMRFQSGDRADIHHVTFDNIRVEYSRYDRAPIYQHTDDTPYAPENKPYAADVIRGWMYCNMWTTDGIFGHVHDVLYRDIQVLADDEVPMPAISFYGADKDHRFERILIENFTFNGQKTEPKLLCNAFADDITVK